MSLPAPIRFVLNGLTNNPLVKQYDVLKYEHAATGFQLKLRVEFVDQSVLFTNEYLSNTTRKYAFHWQQVDETWLIRWDNAPHFPLLTSSPHHRHDYRQGVETVSNSDDIALADVLTYISQQLAPLQP